MKTGKCLGLITLVIVGLVAEDAEARRGRQEAVELAAHRGEMLAQSCFACHGPLGGSLAQAVPTIGGQNAAYLEASLKRFKVPNRPSSVMARLVRGYSDEEIAAMSVYLSRLPFARYPQAIDAERVARGKSIYDTVCIDCHLNSGRESGYADYPILAGQRLAYLRLQMMEIHVTGARSVDVRFEAKLKRLTAEDIDDALHFFAAQGTEGSR